MKMICRESKSAEDYYLFRSPEYTEYHLTPQEHKKLQVHSKTEAVAKVLREKLV